MKLTKDCLHPWTFMQIHAGGMMQCCAVGPDTDLGDFILDYCEKKEYNPDIDPFNSEGLQAVRKGILTGNLRPMCRKCFFTEDKLITVDEMEKKVKDLLKKKNPDVDIDTADLTKMHGYKWMAISFTNKCNLSCIYCVQSTQKETNPFFKMEFPFEYARDTLDLFASQGIEKLSTCVEGEATLYKHWYELFSEFHEKYPNVELWMTTNLNRKYSEKELELLASYTVLDVSIDSVDANVYSELRVNGNLDLLKNNLILIEEKAKQLGKERPTIILHVVVSNKTWRGLEDIADFAIENRYNMLLGNYEERFNTRAFKENILKPLRCLSIDEQKEAYELIQRIKEKGSKNGIRISMQGEIFNDLVSKVNSKFNYFEPYDDNPVYIEFVNKYKHGTEQLHLDIVYDRDDISHEGISMARDAMLELDNLYDVDSIIIREIHIYKKNANLPHYDQNVLLRYRIKYNVEDGKFVYKVNYPNENVERILLEICDVYCKRK